MKLKGPDPTRSELQFLGKFEYRGHSGVCVFVCMCVFECVRERECECVWTCMCTRGHACALKECVCVQIMGVVVHGSISCVCMYVSACVHGCVRVGVVCVCTY